MLVGTKLDIRQEQGHQKVKHVDKRCSVASHDEGHSLADKIHAVKYIECSSKTQEGVTAVFDQAVKSVLFPPVIKKENHIKCDLL